MSKIEELTRTFRDMPVERLATTIQSYNEELSLLREEREAAMHEMRSRALPEVQKAFDHKGRPDGTVHVDLTENLKITAIVRKTVKWDKEKLMQVGQELAETYGRETAERFVRLNPDMTEAQYTAFLLEYKGSGIHDKLEAARTVQYSRPTLDLTFSED